MKSFLQRHWPVPVAVAVYFTLTGLLFAWCIQPGGLFVYPLDDAYIHLAHGRSLGLHGVWGVTSHGFSSSTSSLLWTLLLAGWFRVGGAWELAPLALNLVFGAGLIAAMHGWLRGRVRSGFVEALLLILFVLIVPLPVMTIIGMEHVLQVFLMVIFVALYQRQFADENNFAPLQESMSLPAEATCSIPHSAFRIPHFIMLAGLAALLVMTRYEMLFLAACAGLLLIGRRRWRAGLLLWAAAWLPVLVYGAFSMRQGGWLLPNTLLLKGNMPDGVLATLKRCFAVLQVNLSVYVLLLLAAAAWSVNNSRRWPRQAENTVLILLFIGTAALHTWLAQFGFHFRYEAYLIALGFMALFNFLFTFPFGLRAMALRQRVWTWGAAACLGWLALIPFFPRIIDSIRFTPVSSHNVYDQQYQTARFLKHYYPGAAVAVNDIGMVCWLGDPRLCDMWGLATQPVAEAKRQGTYDRARLDSLTRAAGVDVAVIYEGWFSGMIPEGWIKVAQWRIQNNYICAQDTVTFYAVRPGEAARLAGRLRTFRSQLPSDVLAAGPF